MSVFNWFTQKTPGKAAPAPAMAGTASRTRDESQLASNAESRKTERLERRELLYGVIRESMVHAGALSASYKFKVLSLDSGGRQHMIMMDLAHELEGGAGRLADLEAAIIQSAKTRYEILVTAVYWRVTHRQAAQPAEKIKQGTVNAPIQAKEVSAYKRTSASGPPLAGAEKRGTTAARRAARFPSFADTELTDHAGEPRSQRVMSNNTVT